MRTRGGAGRQIRSQNTAHYFLSIEKADRDTEVKSRTSHYACEATRQGDKKASIRASIRARSGLRADDTMKRTSYRYSLGG